MLNYWQWIKSVVPKDHPIESLELDELERAAIRQSLSEGFQLLVNSYLSRHGDLRGFELSNTESLGLSTQAKQLIRSEPSTATYREKLAKQFISSEVSALVAMTKVAPIWKRLELGQE